MKVNVLGYEKPTFRLVNDGHGRTENRDSDNISVSITKEEGIWAVCFL